MLEKDFVWNDEPESNHEEHPNYHFANQLMECAILIADYVADNISVLSINNEQINVTIPRDIHPLLLEIAETTEESRQSIFEVIRACFALTTGSEFYHARIKQKLAQVGAPVPGSSLQNLTLGHKYSECVDKQEYSISSCHLYDDPIVMAATSTTDSEVSNSMAGGEIVAEINIQFQN